MVLRVNGPVGRREESQREDVSPVTHPAKTPARDTGETPSPVGETTAIGTQKRQGTGRTSNHTPENKGREGNGRGAEARGQPAA